MEYKFLVGFCSEDNHKERLTVNILDGHLYEIWLGDEHVVSGIGKKEALDTITKQLKVIAKKPEVDVLELDEKGKVVNTSSITFSKDKNLPLNFEEIMHHYRTISNPIVSELESFLCDMEEIVVQCAIREDDIEKGEFRPEDDYFNGLNIDRDEEF